MLRVTLVVHDEQAKEGLILQNSFLQHPETGHMLADEFLSWELCKFLCLFLYFTGLNIVKYQYNIGIKRTIN